MIDEPQKSEEFGAAGSAGNTVSAPVSGPVSDNNHDHSVTINRDFVQAIKRALALPAADDARVQLGALVDPLHAADLADVLEHLKPDQRSRLIALMGSDLDAEMLSELDESVRDEVLTQIEPQRLAEAITELDSDDAVHLIEDLEAPHQREILSTMPVEERSALEEGLSYPDESAGRLMQRELIAVPSYWNVGQVIDHLRESDDLPNIFHEIYLIDPTYHPVGSVPLNRILRTKRPVQVSDIMDTDHRTVPVEMDQEEVAFLFQQYDLVSVPVVDDAGRLIGMITIDDVVDVVQEEAEEDIMRLAGVPEGALYDSVLKATGARFSWLLLNLLTAILASVVIAVFDASIEKVVALAILMPVVASMGGNAGTQTLTLTVRALATREMTAANAARIINKEVLIGGVNGLVFAALAGVIAGLWFQDFALGLVLGAAMIINLVVAGCAGILIPLGMVRLRVDPALASSVFVTTITDMVGFFAFLGLATIWIV